jgi:hypothetical protein
LSEELPRYKEKENIVDRLEFEEPITANEYIEACMSGETYNAEDLRSTKSDAIFHQHAKKQH